MALSKPLLSRLLPLPLHIPPQARFLCLAAAATMEVEEEAVGCASATGGGAGGKRAVAVTVSPAAGAPWAQQHPASRIYRVSRASGGKDRHSKVYTAKGIRDRRVCLSVATAI
jgi:hypothetical protein